jgi:quinol monooxygenase YgiN
MFPVPKTPSQICQGWSKLNLEEEPMPKISKNASHQTVITTFEMTPGTCQDLMDALTDAYETFISKQPGFIAAGLHVNDAQTRIANYSQWERREDFQAMLRSDEMRERNRKINQLCRSFEPVMYDVAEAFD